MQEDGHIVFKGKIKVISIILDRFGVPPYKGSKYKIRPNIFAVNISFHVWDISRFSKSWCERVVGGTGAPRVVVAHDLVHGHKHSIYPL